MSNNFINQVISFRSLDSSMPMTGASNTRSASHADGHPTLTSLFPRLFAPSSDVPTRKSAGLGVAIWTKHSQVFQPIVVANTVSVVQRQNKTSSVPCRALAAFITFVTQHTFFKQSSFNVAPTIRRSPDQHTFKSNTFFGKPPTFIGCKTTRNMRPIHSVFLKPPFKNRVTAAASTTKRSENIGQRFRSLHQLRKLTRGHTPNRTSLSCTHTNRLTHRVGSLVGDEDWL